jgi:hypothetical protein
MNIVYGPVPSWRVGRSLGVDPLGGVGEAAKAFWGLSVRCVYEVPRPDVRPLEAASTARHRPEGGTPCGGATQKGVGTGDLYRGARS